jgi:uncharacterized protein (DUF1697 family)
MNTYILLLRGINVGGNGLLPMKELVAILDGIGYKNIQTYIQSGNVVLQHKAKLGKKDADAISKLILKKKGFTPKVLLLEKKELLSAIKSNPFETSDGKALHFYFLESESAKHNINLIESAKAKTESYKLTKQVFYLHAPDGVGKSKLAVTVEKALGVPVTARNWNTVAKLVEMIEGE